MVAVLTPADRTSFKTCRRSWDLAARERRNLEPLVGLGSLDIDRAIRDALAVYYFPGMWDWPRAVVIPLVGQALDKALAHERARPGPEPPVGFERRAQAARQLLAAYVEWAPGIERLAPVLVEVDYAANLADPEQPDGALFTPGGDEHISYRGRVDLLGVDDHDAYWIMRHRVVREWTPLSTLVRDEEAVAACWAWPQHYIGMEIAGTVHNEMRLPTGAPSGDGPDLLSAESARRAAGPVPQHEGSGGGRSVPQHRRLDARASAPAAPKVVEHDTGPWFRRTWIRRSSPEIDQAGRQLASEAREIFDPDVAVFPSPSPPACGNCPFASPCLALYEGKEAEAEAILASSYRTRSTEVVEGRLGGVSWSTGRGAAPPHFTGQGS
jgi:hypothetical protein